MKKDYKEGFLLGIPIGVGYFCVSFAFGMMVKNVALPTWIAFLISATNLTSAGQFAGLNLIVQQAAYVEILMTTLIINLRYAIMSMSLSQKVEEGMGILKRLIMAFGVTDEIFAVSVTRKTDVTLPYFLGIVTPSFIGWTAGTTCGAAFSSILPTMFADAMNIALYGMFVAIVAPKAKESLPLICVVGISIALSCLFFFLPSLSIVSEGLAVCICAIVAAVIGALVFPVKEEQTDE